MNKRLILVWQTFNKSLIKITILFLVTILLSNLASSVPVTQSIPINGAFTLSPNHGANSTLLSFNFTIAIENATFFYNGINTQQSQSFGTFKTIELPAAIDTVTLTSQLVGSYGNQTQQVLQRIDTARADHQAWLEETWFKRWDTTQKDKVDDLQTKLTSCLKDISSQEINLTKSKLERDNALLNESTNKSKWNIWAYISIILLFALLISLALIFHLNKPLGGRV